MSRDEIEIEVDGQKYKGFYVVEKGSITVTSPTLGNKSDAAASSHNDLRAEQLLHELVNASNGHGWKK